jgi:hypothetical protein
MILKEIVFAVAEFMVRGWASLGTPWKLARDSVGEL